LNPEIVRKARDEANFDILYECKFPAEDAVDSKGYAVLVSESELDRSTIEAEDFPFVGNGILGYDVAGAGRNFSTIVFRTENAAKLIWREKTSDTMTVASKVAEFAQKLGVAAGSIAGDDIGIGKGVADRITEILGVYPGINVGTSSEEKERFLNLRAELYWKAADWIKRGNKLLGRGSFDEMLHIRWKTQSDKKIKIKSKDEMRDDGIESPDVADALMLTFSKTAFPSGDVQSDEDRLFDKYNVFGSVT
jgi:hypothetical protein